MNTAQCEPAFTGVSTTQLEELKAPSPLPPQRARAYPGRIKYAVNTGCSYQSKHPRRHAAELRLIDRAFSHVPLRHKVLDLPCRGGRATAHLASRGYVVTAADDSDAMLEIARRNLACYKMVSVHKQDIERLCVADRHFDTILCFRLFHHFPTPDVRQRAVQELCRVARQFVVLSYFSPASFTSLKRACESRVRGKTSKKFATSRDEVTSYFERCGFRLVRDYAQLALVHPLHLAVMERILF